MTPDQPSVPPLLEMRDVVKQYPGVRALDGVDLTLHAGEVLALMGENGAGKSTLIKILGGAIPPDAGEIRIDGQPVSVHSPADAQRLGVGVIYQEFNLVPDLTARENIFLGQEGSSLRWIATADERARTIALFERIGAKIDPEALVRSLPVAAQQSVEIAKVLSLNARILVMDEPSAALSPREVEGLFQIVRGLTAQGIGVIYVSHRLNEIFEIADRVTIFRDGRHVTTQSIEELSRESIIEGMVGRPLDQEFPKHEARLGDVRLSVRGLRRDSIVENVSFDVRAGEIVALTGLVGAGRTETARLIFGADRRDGGEIVIDGKTAAIHSPRDAIAAGICLLTEDRKHQGLVLPLSCRENFALPNLDRFATQGWIHGGAERQAFQEYGDQLQIRLASMEQPTATLSGGNQQKVVLAKWLQRDANVIIFDEPTRGIDVGAKYEIYQLMNRLAEQGKAILMISSELPEALGMADRILVMHEGRLTGEITDVAAATQQQIMDLAVL